MLKFKALADETRLRLLHILFHYELSVNELVKIMDMGQSRISRHLKILAEAQLVISRRDGLWVFYSVPASGEIARFLGDIIPHFPKSQDSVRDLDSAEQMLAERTRRARKFFDVMAEKWDDLNHEILGDFNLAAHVLEALPPACRIAVDLGCGTGVVLTELTNHVELTIGVDGSAGMLDLCRNRLRGREGSVSLRIGELDHLPLADREADFACMNLVLHHLPAPARAFTEIHRILKPGGILFLADFLRHEDEGMRHRYGDHWLGFDRGEIEKYLDAGGFAVRSLQMAGVGRNLTLILLEAAAC